MKNILRISAMLLVLTGILYKVNKARVQENEAKVEEKLDERKGKRKVQVAILLDTSNSMDGLIEQAKSRLWDIVNTLSTLYYDGAPANIEIALYQYGNDNLSSERYYIQQVKSFSTNLDAISESLFGLRTLGGEEYCGAVLSDATQNLQWSKSNQDIKLIYIAGNESFKQGPKDYRKIITAFKKENDIQVNTIFCGNYNEGRELFWSDGAKLGKGKYFAINSDDRVQHIATPYDDSILFYNQKLNDTYIAYGHDKIAKKSFMESQDLKASNSSKETLTKRAVSKSKKSVYKNESWDVVDAYEKAPEAIAQMSEEELPDEMQGMNSTEKTAFVKEKQKERNAIQSKISELNKKRNSYVKEKRSQSKGKSEDDFGLAVVQSISEIAQTKGYEIKED